MKRLTVLGYTKRFTPIFILVLSLVVLSCKETKKEGSSKDLSAAAFLGNPEYSAISYGGYRTNSREVQPTITQIKADLQILHAMGVRIVRTYNLQFEHSPNVVKAIAELRKEDPNFEMYVMLGTWIDCKDAWTEKPDHSQESLANNSSEIEKAIALTNEYPEIIKIIAVGNEAMVHWAWSYHVAPAVILKWVKHLQQLKREGQLPKNLWITSSDNFASWGGGDTSYHTEDLTKLMAAVDYISVHTYPFHDTHHNPSFWKEAPGNNLTTKEERIDFSMEQATNYAKMQYAQVKTHMQSLGIDKPIHIGETGWSSNAINLFDKKGSRAADEYKQALYYNKMHAWAKENKITCFYFSAFDEPWKDPNGLDASENNFGLFTVDGKAKFALWPLVDQGVFKGLRREEAGAEIGKTFNGELSSLLNQTHQPNYTP